GNVASVAYWATIRQRAGARSKRFLPTNPEAPVSRSFTIEERRQPRWRPTDLDATQWSTAGLHTSLTAASRWNTAETRCASAARSFGARHRKYASMPNAPHMKAASPANISHEEASTCDKAYPKPMIGMAQTAGRR